jgi:hypothetical protein
MVHEVKVDTGDALLERILDAARRMNNPRVLLTFSHSILKRAGLCIQAEGGYFDDP